MKKGFTLIELLAVIVVMAIVALIATPLISNVITGAKQKSSMTNAQNYVNSVNNAYALTMTDSNREYLKDKETLETGFDDNELAEVQVSGKKPSYVKIEYDKSKNRVKEGKFCVDGVSIDYVDGEAIVSTNDYCHIELAPGLYDKNNNLLVSWDSLVNDYGLDLRYVYNEQTGYTKTSSGWTYRNYFEPYETGSIALENIHSGDPNVVFAQNNFEGAAKLVLTSEYGEVPRLAFYNFDKEIEIIIPKGITLIDEGAFSKSKITGVNIGPDVTEIKSCFYETKNLKRLVIPDNVTKIGEQTDILYDSGVEYIKLGNGITEIYDDFCYQCKNLKKVELSSSVKKIDSYAFAYSGIEEINLPEGLEEIKNAAFYYTYELKDIVLPDSLTTLGMGAFYESGLTSLTIGSGLTKIPGNAFYRTHLKTITIPSNVKEIGSSAFYATPATKIDLGSVEVIAAQAFAYATNLKEIRVPATVRILGNAFVTGVGDRGKPSALKRIILENMTYWADVKCNEYSESDINGFISNTINNVHEFPFLTHFNDMSECEPIKFGFGV